MVRIFWYSAGIILFLDQLLKYIVEVANPSVQILPFFSIEYVRNIGAGFGILPGKQLLFIIIAFIVLFLIYKYYGSIPKTISIQVAYGIITGGVVGNLLDRIFRGYVVDFLDFFIGTFHWPAFNIADAGLVVGIIILLYHNMKN